MLRLLAPRLTLRADAGSTSSLSPRWPGIQVTRDTWALLRGPPVCSCHLHTLLAPSFLAVTGASVLSHCGCPWCRVGRDQGCCSGPRSAQDAAQSGRVSVSAALGDTVRMYACWRPQPGTAPAVCGEGPAWTPLRRGGVVCTHPHFLLPLDSGVWGKWQRDCLGGTVWDGVGLITTDNRTQVTFICSRRVQGGR